MAHLHPVSGEPSELVELLRAWDAEESPEPLVVETSGTTGRPKRVRLSRSAMRASVDATHGYLGGPGQWLLAVPARYVAGLQVLFRNVRAGQEPVVLQGDSWEEAVAAMSGRRRYTAVVPTQLVRLLDRGRVGPLAELDAVLVGGGPLDPVLRSEAEQAGVRVVTTYGMSETCGGCVYDGHPLEGVSIKIDQDGEILLTGTMLFAGYDDGQGGIDEVAGAAIRHSVWLRTSDLGRLDADGCLEVLGRRDQVVVSGGLNVPGLAVEQMLARAPGVRDVAVIGLPHPEWGQQVTAVVVPDAEVPDLARLRDAVSPREWAPRAVVVVPELPRTANGKLDRAAVRELAQRGSVGPR